MDMMRISPFEWNILSLNFAYFKRKNMFDPMVAVINNMSTSHWFRLLWAGWRIFFGEDAAIVAVATENIRSPCCKIRRFHNRSEAFIAPSDILTQQHQRSILMVLISFNTLKRSNWINTVVRYYFLPYLIYHFFV